MNRSHFINGRWIEGSGSEFASIDPAGGEVLWTGREAEGAEIDSAIAAAQHAFEGWAHLSREERAQALHAFGAQVKAHHADFTRTICRETGKPRWEAATETDALVNKIDATLDAANARRQPSSRPVGPSGIGTTRYKPHGVVAVLGPFNFPAHLPNGHIMPALLAGNTVVFKPSELTPLVGQRMVELWESAGLPRGVVNLVQGGRTTGERLVCHGGIDGVFFTGSFAAGRAINRALADEPGKVLALEMGGNNPLIIHRVHDRTAAAYWTIQSAYITAGQRCSCARRLIVVDDAEAASFLERLKEMVEGIVVGRYTDSPEPFMGPVISDAAAAKLIEAQDEMLGRGGHALVLMRPAGLRAAMLTPGLIDMTAARERPDEEIFGPLLQVIRVADFDHAIEEANRTAYGLTAGLFSDERDLWEVFWRKTRAGVVNWNRPLTGASGLLPFGGIGRSGNHRPSAYFAADYCSYPVASMEQASLAMPAAPTPGVANW